MTTKLTLTVQEATVKGAKLYAKHTGRSLSELVENYFQSLIKEPGEKEQLSPQLRSLIGAVKLPEDFDEKKEIHDYLINKHL